MEMMPMLLIITMATYTLGKIAMTAVPMKENTKKREIRALLTIQCAFLLYCGLLMQSIPMENPSVPRM